MPKPIVPPPVNPVAPLPAAFVPTDVIAPYCGYGNSTFLRIAENNAHRGFPRPVGGGKGSRKLWDVAAVLAFFSRVSAGKVELLNAEPRNRPQK